MCARCLCWCVLFLAWVLLSGGVRLYPCGDAGYQDVEENTTLTFYCDQYTGSVEWRFKSVRGGRTFISLCDSTCTPYPDPLWWTVRAISSTNSSLTTSLTSRNPSFSGAKYLCDFEQCGLHVFVPAVVSQPTSPVINRQDSGYTLSVAANITRVYSSRGLYSCVGQLGSSRLTTTPDLSPPAADTNNTADRTGRCDVTMSLPDTSGTYPCSVTVTPGNMQTSCGSFTMTRPSPPTISCPSDFIAENTTLTCTCNTENIGQPGGRLRWFTGTGSDINIEVISGTYDVSTLKMTRTVTRGDDDNRKFRCVNNWVVNVTAQSDYTARVAWGPDTVSIQGNTPFFTDITGSQTMTLTCGASGVKPTSALTYNWDVLCDDRQQSTCTFRPRPGPSGDDNRVITCTVTNTKNNNHRQQSSVILDIKYPPLSAPQISGYNKGQVLYESDSLTLSCTITGGDPVVTSVSLTCPGRQEQSPTIGQFSSLVISRLNATDHNLTCVCRGQWVRESYYTLTDSRTLTVNFAVRSVQLTVNSQPTLVEVKESQSTDVVFQCTAGFARPSPHLILSDDQGREVARLTSKSSDVTGPGQQFVLTHTLRRVRCENSAVYTCTAQNGVGKPVNATATLRVLCDMRILRDSFSSQEDGVPVLVASTGELHFQILTTRTPDTASFLYLGPDSMGDGYPPASGLLSADCQKTSVAYKSSCVLTASNVTQNWIGYYNVTMATAAQAVTFTFRLQMKKSSANSGPTCNFRQCTGEFGVGMGVGLAILLIVQLVQLLCLWRRQWRLSCTGERPNQPADERAGQREPSLETEMSTCVTDTGPYEELKHTDIGLRSEYSVMSDSAPTTAQYTPETEGGYEIPRQRAAVPAAAATGR